MTPQPTEDEVDTQGKIIGEEYMCTGMVERSNDEASSPKAYAVTAVAGVSAHAMRPGIRIGKEDHRPWLEKWRFVLHHLARLREYYETDVSNSGNLDVEAWASGFFVECDHLVDWLCGDVSALGGVTEAQITDHAKTSSALQHCDAISNTHKHYARTASKKGKPSKQMARIGEVECQSNGRWRMTVELDWLARAHGPTVDALVLADECVAEWRRFFTLHGITEPT